MRSAIFVAVFAVACTVSSFAGTTVVPTTTLTAETANNTSASSTWTNATTGDAVPGNVSQVDVHSLLYAGETTKVYAHYMPWWGSGGHISVGYNSATLAQAHATITDMMNRGIDGLIIDWYGPSKTQLDQASLYIKQDAETRGGKFTFAIMEDQGAVRACAYTSGCDATQAVINDFNYIIATYASSPAYLRVNGQPLIFTFDTENLPNIDWTRVMATVQGNPKIVLRNDNGFRRTFTSGSYSWVTIDKTNPDNWGQAYLDDFYVTSRSYPSEFVFAGTWKGFNDNLASWGQNRVVNQNCGQTWLTTFNEMNKYFSTAQQPTGVQLVTWNDYEEGSEIETGIDNCVSVSGSAVGPTLYWSISGGQENTIDHYTIFVSLDGENLMKVTDAATGTNQLDLSSFGLAPANYTLYVKAVGKPSILNKMSGPIPYTVANQPPAAALSVTPSSGTAPVTVTASTAGSMDPDGTIAATTIDFGDGAVVSGTSASHTYSAAGTYTVTATVTDNDGAMASSTASVNVIAPFTVTPVSPLNGTTVGQKVHFVATANSPSSPVTAMRIYVDSQSLYTVSAASIDTILAIPVGNHSVVLQAWNALGKVAKAAMNITVVNQPPVVSLSVTPSSGTGTLNVAAVASGSDPDGSIAVTTINFGDGAVANAASATHLYMAAGKYTVTAMVTDNSGATASAQTVVTIAAVNHPLRPVRGTQDVGSAPTTQTTTARASAMRVSANKSPSGRFVRANTDSMESLFSMTRVPRYVVAQPWIEDVSAHRKDDADEGKKSASPRSAGLTGAIQAVE